MSLRVPPSPRVTSVPPATVRSGPRRPSTSAATPAPRPPVRPHPLLPELRGHLGTHLLARPRRHREIQRGDLRGQRPCGRAAASRSTPARRPTPPRGRSRAGSKSAPSSRSTHGSTFLLNAAVTPRVVVRGDERGLVLDQVGAEQQRVARATAGRCTEAEERGALRRAADCRSCRRGTPSAAAPAVVGQREPAREVGDQRVHRQPRMLGEQRVPGQVEGALADVHRNVGVQRRSAPRSDGGSSRRSRSPARPACGRRWRRGDLAGARDEDLPLRAGRVVLGQPGDLLEEFAALGVVEPLRRQLLGVRVSPSATSARRAAAVASAGRVRVTVKGLTRLRLLERGEQYVGAGGGEQRAVGDLAASADRRRTARRPRPRRAVRAGQVPERVAPGGGGDRLPVGEQQVEPRTGGRRGHLRTVSGQRLGPGSSPAAAGAATAPRRAPSRSAPPDRADRRAAGTRRARRASRGQPLDGAVVAEQPGAGGERRGAAASPSAPATVASRTAASSAPAAYHPGQIGERQVAPRWARRAGSARAPGRPRAYQPTPKPSALTVPCRCRRGAQDCVYRLCRCDDDLADGRSGPGTPDAAHRRPGEPHVPAEVRWRVRRPPPGRVAGGAEAREDLAADRIGPSCGTCPRQATASTAKEPPRSTLYVGPEEDLRVLPVREGREPRVGQEVARRPLPHVPDQLPYAQRRGALRIAAGRCGPQMALAEVGVLGGGVRVAPRVAPGPAARRVVAGGLLPLRLGGQPPPGPAGVGVRLVPAHVQHRLVRAAPARSPRSAGAATGRPRAARTAGRSGRVRWMCAQPSAVHQRRSV